MDVRVGDVLELKQEHPCGSKDSIKFILLHNASIIIAKR